MSASTSFSLPFHPPLQHMLAKAGDEIPAGSGWTYEPKRDGFRALVSFAGASVFLQSPDLDPLGGYFAELETGLREALTGPLVLDGEVVVVTGHGLDFDSLQMRIHPAASRVKMLSETTPSSFVAFDLLASGDSDLRMTPYTERRARLDE